MWSGTWGDGQCHGGLTSVRLCSRPETSSWREKEKWGGIGLMMWFLFKQMKERGKMWEAWVLLFTENIPAMLFIILPLVFAAKKEKTKRHKWIEWGNKLVYLWTLGRMLAVPNLKCWRKYFFLLYFFISQRRIWEAEMPWSFSWSVLG